MNQSSGPGRNVNRSTPAASHPSATAAAAAAGLVIVSGRSVVDSSRSTVDGSSPTTNNRTHHQHVAAMISTQLRHGADVIGSRRRRWSGSMDSRWFVRPIHLHSGPSNDGSTSSDAAILFAADQRGSSSSSFRVENGVLTSSRSTSSNPPAVESSAVDRNSVDDLLKTYFPATVTASRLREAVTAVESESSPSPRQLFQHQSSLPDPVTLPYESETDSPSKRVPADSAGRTGRKFRHASSVGGTTGRDSRPSSTKSSSSSASNGSYDRMYLNDSQSGLPLTALMSSPYKTELARLRLDRLRLEEEQLLELKRQTELERIRGPEPKWYEMRSSGFHREVRRNNELLRNRDSWQAMLDYRVELERASQNLTSTLTRSPGSSVAAIGNVE